VIIAGVVCKLQDVTEQTLIYVVDDNQNHDIGHRNCGTPEISVVFLIVLIHIIIFIVLRVHIYDFIYIYFCTRIPVSASEPRCSIISVHEICPLIDFYIYMCTLIIKFNSIHNNVRLFILL